MQITQEELRQIIKEELSAVLDEKRKKKKKKKKKKKGKKDACYHKVRSRYDVWPSAYASGALVKCRKVGAKNWGNSKNESMNEEVTPEEEEELKDIKGELEKASETHKGQAKRVDDIVKSETKKKRNGLTNINEVSTVVVQKGSHKERIVLDEKKKKRKKAGTESSKEGNLRDWFKRKGAKGKKGGWVDCNAPDGKGGYKSCGRGDGEKRKKYPACRPTPGACKERGKGKSWGKKAKKGKK